MEAAAESKSKLSNDELLSKYINTYLRSENIGDELEVREKGVNSETGVS